MNRSVVNLLVAAVMVVGIGGLVFSQKQGTQSQTGSDTGNSSAMALADVALHNTRGDCWTVINGSVYDLTSWIPQHPGGEQAILQLCGTDGSASFNGMHGGAPQQAAILAGFKVGQTDGAAASPQVAAPTVDDNDSSGRGRGRGGNDED